MSAVKVVITEVCDEREQENVVRFLQDSLGWKEGVDFKIEHGVMPGNTISGGGDDLIRCIDCGNTFPFTAGERQFFATNNLVPPKRCKDCRAKKKEQREADFNGSPKKRHDFARR